MTYFEDLSSYYGDPYASRNILAVGWLERGRAYQKGAVEEEVVAALVKLLVDPWQPAVAGGWHACSFCRFSGGPGMLVYKGTKIRMGSANLYVPGDQCVYVTPSLIAHYMDAHEYAPPQPFCQALLACPPMRSMAYFRALLASNEGRFLVRLSRR